ncbi:MAG: M20/M25/M40 family metallo-hydrolase [Candidatus Thorarchaeota archaeon]
MKVSIDEIRKTIEELCRFENRIAGTKMEHETAEYLIDRLSAMGYAEIKKHDFPVISWHPKETALEMISPTKQVIRCAPMPYTTSVDETFRLIDMDSDEKVKSDKFPVYGLSDWGVHIYQTPSHAYNTALEMGLDGVIISSPKEGDLLKVLVVARGSELQIPVLSISKEDGMKLREVMKESEVVLKVRTIVDKGESVSSNIEVVLPGNDPDFDILIGAHYDAWFAGAADNAAPVAVVLEAARLMKEQEGKHKRTIRFLLFGAEESGVEGYFFWINGSRHYVQSQPSLDSIGLVVCLDSVGYSAQNYVVTTHETIYFAKEITKELEEEDRFFHYSPPGYGSDHWFFTQNGVPTIYLISWPSDLYHTQKDIPDVLDYDSIEAYARYVVNAAVEFTRNYELPYDIIHQIEQIWERFRSVEDRNLVDLKSLIEVLSEILEMKSEFEIYMKKDRSIEEKALHNKALRQIVGKVNKTLGLLLPVKGFSEAKHLPALDLIQDVTELESVIKTLEKIPIMDITPGSREQFRTFEDTPVTWSEVEKPLAALIAERERILKKINKDVAKTKDVFVEIQRAIEALLN